MSIRTRPANKKYRDNFDAVFKRKPPKAELPTVTYPLEPFQICEGCNGFNCECRCPVTGKQ
jgi:hypothetical protein